MGMGMGMDWRHYGVLGNCIYDTLHWGTCYGYNDPNFWLLTTLRLILLEAYISLTIGTDVLNVVIITFIICTRT